MEKQDLLPLKITCVVIMAKGINSVWKFNLIKDVTPLKITNHVDIVLYVKFK